MDENGLSPEAVKAWCDELRRSKARVAFMRDELPVIIAESGEEVAAALRADLELLDIHATLLDAWILTAGVAIGAGLPARSAA
ncbi:hypothetical protein J5Y09_04170 [Roseomonas sp. PWR1]|uniref:Uncharacterized protein n=1 Tax=Roseomonas nitratireducens TaxID=2820810 RepID=A0ABS4AP06_9PROT|nr:hypothetical protein [Neoroseomonas nitratireducens]MBP0463097.1 hypothetical protein [Neoroseomonas nitratireducens]